MKYPQITRGIEAGSVPAVPAAPAVTPSGGPAGAPITPVTEPVVSPPEPLTPLDWRSALPEDLRVAPALHDIGDVNSLAKQFVDQQAFMGNALRVPGPDAGSDDISSFHQRLIEKVPGLMPRPDPTDENAKEAIYTAMGRPATAEEYRAPVIEGKETASNEALDQAFAESAHRNGLSQSQYHNVMEDIINSQGVEGSKIQAARDAGLSELKQEWGYTYDNRVEAVKAVMGQMGFSEVVIEAVDNQGLQKQDMTAFYNIVTALGGEEKIGSVPSGAATGMTPAEANAQIHEIMSKPEYRHHDLAVRQPWMDKVQELMKYASPNSLHGDDAVLDLRRSSGG